jgi:hypothetical protein
MNPPDLQITYHGLESSPALTDRVRREAARLERYFDRMTYCRVVIDRPHHHHRHGAAFDVHIEIGVPRDKLVVHHVPSGHRVLEEEGAASSSKSLEVKPAISDPYVAVRDAFIAARRLLEDYARRLRGDVKRHAPPGDAA